jgi:hypothetical protein
MYPVFLRIVKSFFEIFGEELWMQLKIGQEVRTGKRQKRVFPDSPVYRTSEQTSQLSAAKGFARKTSPSTEGGTVPANLSQARYSDFDHPFPLPSSSTARTVSTGTL